MTKSIRRFSVRVMLVAPVLLLLAGCHRRAIPVTEPVPVSVVPPGLPESPSDIVYSGLSSGAQVFSFYRDVSFVPQWDSGGDSLLQILLDARSYGLQPDHYHVAALRDSVLPAPRRDVLLTDAFLSFGHDLRYGRGDVTQRPPDDSARISMLKRTVVDGQLRRHLESLEPPYQGYRQLRNALGRLVRSPSVPSDSALTIRTLIVNLKRWRKEETPWSGRYVLVNVPSFMLYVVDGDSVLFSSRIVVGEPATPTPELSSVITRVVTYPYWHVPRKIAVKEYLPAIQLDVGVLDRNNFEVLDRAGTVLNPDSVDWASFNADNFPVSLRQKEGRENALGVIKFEFKNPYAVFLHDTNSRRLFKEEVRAFSHGCIRMEEAEAMAHYLVTNTQQRKSARLTELLSQRKRHVINLSAPIPIYIRYFTAEVRDGELRFYADLYGMDFLD